MLNSYTDCVAELYTIEKNLRDYQYQKATELTALIQRFVYRVPKVTRTQPDLDKMVSNAIE